VRGLSVRAFRSALATAVHGRVTSKVVTVAGGGDSEAEAGAAPARAEPPLRDAEVATVVDSDIHPDDSISNVGSPQAQPPEPDHSLDDEEEMDEEEMDEEEEEEEEGGTCVPSASSGTTAPSSARRSARGSGGDVRYVWAPV